MAREVRIDGDRWRVKLGEEPPRAGWRAVVFFPVTCDQRPFRVVEVDEERVPGPEALEALSERELVRLFEESSSLGAPRTYA